MRSKGLALGNREAITAAPFRPCLYIMTRDII